MATKYKPRAPKTHCAKGLHLKTAENVRVERTLKNGVVYFVRRCKICQSIRWEEWHANKIGKAPHCPKETARPRKEGPRKMDRIESEIKGPGLISPAARLEYRALVPDQLLILTREPTNTVDPNAVVAKTLLLQPCGYVARAQAMVIAPEMDAGTVWLCKVTKKGSAFQCPQVVLWKRLGLRRFRTDAILQGLPEELVSMVLQGGFLNPPGIDPSMQAFSAYADSLPDPPICGDTRWSYMLRAWCWAWEGGVPKYS